MTIVLGVTGSIAAYKSADIVSGLVKRNICVNVVMTKAATKFITPLTLQTLSKNKVYTDVFQEDLPHEVMHISLAKQADIILIAPATANIIGKLAAGIADDMLTAIVVATKAKILIAPAMNTNMYESKIVTENLAKLKERGYHEIEPKTSLLACGDVGRGALADIAHIIEVVEGIKQY